MSVSDGEFNDRWGADAKPERDWKKLFLMIGLGVLSWVATYVGMLELIEANLGDLPLTHKVITAGAVAMLMTMIIWLLDQIFAQIPPFTKFIYIIGYIFLTIISVGFGFGFYWKVLESRGETTRSAAGAVSQVQNSLIGASARLDQLQATLDHLTQVSREKAQIERDKGTSCPKSRPGDGPRRQLRDSDAAQFSFASEFVAGRAAHFKGELKGLEDSLAMVVKGDAKTLDSATGTRNEYMRGLNGKLDGTVARYNAFRSDPQLRQIRANLAERSEKTIFPDSIGGTFSCPDPQLQMALGGVVRAIDQLPDVVKPQINSVEGSEATVEAFRRLGATVFGLMTLKMPPSADELREKQKQAVLSLQKSGSEQAVRSIDAQQSGLAMRDYIPLSIAAFVDLCLLLVAMGRPMNRLNGLIPTMQAAEQGPMYDILSKFSEIHKTPEIREKFEVFRHVVFDFNGDYYVAVPLDAPDRYSQAHGRVSTDDIEALQQEAHLLANFFASFERKQIFKRVYSPLLSTKSIQKRLARQGSKFAHSRAFRVYRFRNGAWSEIILNTIMRAAQEVERSRRRAGKTVEAAPELPMAAPSRRSVGNELKLDPQDDGFDPMWRPDVAYGRARARPRPTADVEIRSAQFGPYDKFVGRDYDDANAPDQMPDVRFRKSDLRRDRFDGAANANTIERQTNAAGDSQDDKVVPFDPSKGGPRGLIASRDSEPLPRIFSNGQAAVAARTDTGMHATGIDVVITERKAEFTVPVSDAVLPAGVRQALASQPVTLSVAHHNAHTPNLVAEERTVPVTDTLLEEDRDDEEKISRDPGST